MLEVNTYPSPNDENMVEKLFKKRELHINMKEKRGLIKNFDEAQEYRRKICRPDTIQLAPHQTMLANFINPYTPYKGLLLFQGVGTGKTGAAINVAEGFKNNVDKYGNKIMVLVPGPLNKENFKKEILLFTRDTYKKYIDPASKISKQEKDFVKKNAMNNILKYYSFASFSSFYKKVLGERIVEKDENGKKISYRKSDDGEILREESSSHIDSLDNTLLIVDEAHHAVDNQFGYAIEKIIRASKNLKVLLMTATPVQNLGEDIIPLINYLRPENDPIKRDKVFTSERGHTMEFTSNGKEYLGRMTRGYVSYLRGADPLTFAKRIDMGIIPPGLIFSKVIRCSMKKFQLTAYEESAKYKTIGIDKRSEAVANMVVPILKGKELIGISGNQGLVDLSNQLKTLSSELNKKMSDMFDVDETMITENNGRISGPFLKKKYLENFSAKFYRALVNLEELVIGKRGPGLAFVYSNLVHIGINVFREILEQNGYLEYEKSDPQGLKAKSDTICYYCGEKKQGHSSLHAYYPARFISITGSNEEEEFADVDAMDILDDVFKSIHNKDGKFIKIVLGSSVMNEGITLNNIKDIHILDVYYNLGRVDQVIGRGLRFCKHYDVTTAENPEPSVSIYKYVVSFSESSDVLTSDEELYRKAEQKYLLIKQIERIMIENAVDCPIHRNSNIFPEEKIYDHCKVPTLENNGEKNICPAVCGYNSCHYICSDKGLLKYYDKDNDLYRFLDKEELDYSTFNNTLARNEINQTKNIIKNLFKLTDAYTLDEVLKIVKKEYIKEYLKGKENLFDDFFVYQALDELIPTKQNDFNNFTDVLTNRYNTSGYLIYRGKYYIFQPFNEPENVPLYYRSKINKIDSRETKLGDYVQNYKKYVLVKRELEEEVKDYDFDTVMDVYYNQREEFDYVGIIDKIRTEFITSEKNDVFKLRPKRNVNSKKRGSNIFTLKGTVCETKEKSEVIEVARRLKIETKNKMKSELCDEIKTKLLNLEKYSTGKDKKTYVIIPQNHPKYPFPYNLEDRIEHIKKSLQTKDIKITSDAKKGYIMKIHTTFEKDKIALEKYKKNGYYEIIIS